MDPELQKLIADFEIFKSNTAIQLQKIQLDQAKIDIQYKTIVPQGVNHKLASKLSVDPGHHHTSASLDIVATNVLGYDITKTASIPQVVKLASTFTKTTDATPATITGMQWTVVAGKTYILKARLILEASNATGGVALQINGTMNTSQLLWSLKVTGDDLLVKLCTDSASLGSSFTTAGRTFYLAEINAGFNCSVGGTVNIQFAQAVANGNSSVDHDSFAELIQIS